MLREVTQKLFSSLASVTRDEELVELVQYLLVLNLEDHPLASGMHHEWSECADRG